MSISVTLDGQDITETLNNQYPLPDSIYDGIFPSRDTGKWYDLLKCINANSTLREHYFNADDATYGGMHQLSIVDSYGTKYDVKLLLRAKYSARNS